MKTENRFSPSPAALRNQATLRHPERSTYRCFLTDLAGFIDICRAGPDYAGRQDRKKTGPFHSCFLLWNGFILPPKRETVKHFWDPGRALALDNSPAPSLTLLQ